MKWVGYVAYWEDKKCVQNLSETLKGGDCSGDVGLDGKIIVIWILKKYSVGLWIGLNWLIIQLSGRLL
jgi:hypothetical protein